MNFQNGDQVTTPEGPGIICWAASKYSVLLYGSQRVIKVNRNMVAPWPAPREAGA